MEKNAAKDGQWSPPQLGTKPKATVQVGHRNARDTARTARCCLGGSRTPLGSRGCDRRLRPTRRHGGCAPPQPPQLGGKSVEDLFGDNDDEYDAELKVSKKSDLLMAIRRRQLDDQARSRAQQTPRLTRLCPRMRSPAARAVTVLVITTLP